MISSKKYQEYKSSGIDFIGDIPKHWEVRKLKFIIDKILGGGTPLTSNSDYWTENKDDGLRWVAIADITKSEYIENTKKYITIDGLNNSSAQRIEPYSILYSIYASLGKVAFSKYELTTNQAILSIKPSENLQYKFLFYYLKTLEDKLPFLSSSTTQNNISLDIVKNFDITVPPLNEQEKIANFLDTKTKQIEEFIKDKLHQISLLEEQKEAIINKAVTKGLDDSVEFKDSGIEWIGDIPTHWDIRRVATLGSFSKGRGISKDSLTETGLSAIVYGDIYTKYNIQTKEMKNYISDNTAKKSKKLEYGDLLFTGSGETKEDIGKCITYLGNKDAYAGGDVIILTDISADSLFLSYSLNSKGAIAQKMNMAKGDIIVHIYASNLREILIAYPTNNEQEEISKYIETELAKIDEVINQIKKEIDLIKEYKVSLISEVVTGQIKVI